MAQTYSIEFKEEACKRVQSGVPAAKVARELGVNVNTLYTWMSRFKELLWSSIFVTLMANKISFQVMKQSVPDKVYGIHYSCADEHGCM